MVATTAREDKKIDDVCSLPSTFTKNKKNLVGNMKEKAPNAMMTTGNVNCLIIMAPAKMMNFAPPPPMAVPKTVPRFM